VSTNALNFAIFCKSFRAASVDGTAIVFLNRPVSERLLSIAGNSSVYLIEFVAESMQPTFLRNFHPSSQRWIFFERLLRVHDCILARSFDVVLTADVRDAYFQSDPFLLVTTADELHVFGENPVAFIYACGSWKIFLIHSLLFVLHTLYSSSFEP
jgi:hypothetical protein